ncbi:MAG TPA: hypothetical protein VGC66_03780 [Pyrinomonadaceae bacterium]|jgi:hypothetical protein
MRYIDYFASLLPQSAAARLNYLRVTVVCAYACGMLTSPGLWFGTGRTFPHAPLLSGLPYSLSSADYLLSLLLLAAIVLAAVSKRPRRYIVAVLALSVLLVVLDQTRLQPWVYQYLIMLAVLACVRSGEDDEESAGLTIAANQLVIAMLYFWSGAQKLNWSFGHEVMPGLLASAGVHLSPAYVSYLPAIGIVAALCEAFTGIALLVRKTRRMGVLLALCMHLLVLVMLVAAWRNSVVWVWNVFMMVMVVLLFWRSQHTVNCHVLWKWRGATPSSHAAKAVIVVCGLAPALSFIGWWDMYLSSALYSGNTTIAVARISERVRDRLPATAQQQVFKTRRGEMMLPFYEWSMTELNVPPYPETRVYRQLAREVCRYAEEPQEVELIVRERPSLIDGSYAVSRADCQNLFAQ